MTGRQEQHYVCISCPIGCPLRLVHEGDTILEIEGQECNRGAKYARQEFTDPRRTFSTTVPIAGAVYGRLPVKLSAPVPRQAIPAAMDAIRHLRAEAPVSLGQVLLRDVAGVAGVDVVACRTMDRVMITLS
ncbi:MAG: molybdopterin oxidoreductase [Deltaproteobacteria bacterium HGW-Deltaproteobacteria-17]|nr:MAG: molybdopterin oxidoreductase [Deltaproteobacteria bacterium HGW-Deltaproteobacteria-17]